MCECEFAPYEDDDDEFGEDSYHYKRTCLFCGHIWWGLHCPHDKNQSVCVRCGIAPVVLLGVE